MKEFRCLLYNVKGVSFVSEESSGNRTCFRMRESNRCPYGRIAGQTSRCKRNSWFRKRLIWGELAAHFLKVVPLLPDDSIGLFFLFIVELGNGVPIPLGEFFL